MSLTESPFPQKLDPDFKSKWLAALRSGDYAQGRTCLRHTVRPSGDPDWYCCLGVAADLLAVEGHAAWKQLRDETYFITLSAQEDEHSGAILLDTLRRRIGLSDRNQSQLMTLNDTEDRSFTEIADWIEENL